MLGIGMQEILIILVVALIVIGPKKLPELARTLGKGFAEFRKAADDLQETVRMDLQKERQEELRQKYPHLVPEEDEDTASQADSKAESTEETSTSVGSGPVKPEPAPESVTEQPAGASYAPDEIEGGLDTEDDTRDG
ncbi:MAG: twin-arginine translocase subunit TatB [bacterium]|nr:MAG: twin-arginine translocase subunit TatB [bacterium]